MNRISVLVILFAFKTVSMDETNDWTLFCSEDYFDSIASVTTFQPLEQKIQFRRVIVNTNQTNVWRALYNSSSDALYDMNHIIENTDVIQRWFSLHYNKSSNLYLKLNTSTEVYYWSVNQSHDKHDIPIPSSEQMLYSGLFWWNSFKDIYIVGENERLNSIERNQRIFKLSAFEKPLVPINRGVLQLFGCPEREPRIDRWLWIALISIICVITTVVVIDAIVYFRHKNRNFVNNTYGSKTTGNSKPSGTALHSSVDSINKSSTSIASEDKRPIGKLRSDISSQTSDSTKQTIGGQKRKLIN